MSNVILAIPVDNQGNKLFLRDLKVEENKIFVRYRSTYNNIPFQEIELITIDGNYVITGDDGTVLYRFSKQWLEVIQ